MWKCSKGSARSQNKTNIFSAFQHVLFALSPFTSLYCVWTGNDWNVLYYIVHGVYKLLGKKALYYNKCCSLAVRGCWLHESVTVLAWQWVRNDESTSVVLLSSPFVCCFTHHVIFLFSFWVSKKRKIQP